MFKQFLCGLTGLAFAGCASTQLNYNTVEISTTVSSLYTRQALENLSAFIDDPYAIPSQLDFTGGTVQTVNTINPSFTFPMTSMVANTITTSATPSNVNAVTRAGAGATIGATNTQQQNWNIVPVDDANALRNLQALYRHIIYGGSSLRDYYPSRVYVNGQFYFDPYQLKQPHCVWCEDKPSSSLHADLKDLHANKKLMHDRWLFWDNGPATPLNDPYIGRDQLKDLGFFGTHELYATKEAIAEGYLTNFVYFTLPYSGPTESFVQKSAGDGGAPAPAQGKASDATNGRQSSPRNSTVLPSFKALGIQ